MKKLRKVLKYLFDLVYISYLCYMAAIGQIFLIQIIISNTKISLTYFIFLFIINLFILDRFYIKDRNFFHVKYGRRVTDKIEKF